MTSNINSSVPVTGNPSTSSVRENFAIAALEISDLQNAVNSGTPLAPLLTAINNLVGTGAIAITGVNTVALINITSLAQALLGNSTTTAMQVTLGLGSAALHSANDFLLSTTTIPASSLPLMTGSTPAVTGTSGLTPAPPAASVPLFLNSSAIWTGLQGNVTGPINGQNNLFSGLNVDNPRYKFIDNGNSGTSITINISVAHHQRVTLTTSTPTISITAFPPAGTVYQLVLEIVQDSTGSRVPTFAGSTFQQAGGTSPAWSTAGGKKDIIVIYSPDGGATSILSVAGFDYR